jgi:hypothetical protein
MYGSRVEGQKKNTKPHTFVESYMNTLYLMGDFFFKSLAGPWELYVKEIGRFTLDLNP